MVMVGVSGGAIADFGKWNTIHLLNIKAKNLAKGTKLNKIIASINCVSNALPLKRNIFFLSHVVLTICLSQTRVRRSVKAVSIRRT